MTGPLIPLFETSLPHTLEEIHTHHSGETLHSAAQQPVHILQLQDRDRRLLLALHQYNGVLSDIQIQALIPFGYRSFARRIGQLEQAGYLARRTCQLGCIVNFLTRAGAIEVASLKGAAFSAFKWRRPGERWPEVPHDVRTNEFVIALEQAIGDIPGMSVLESLSDYELRRFPDQIILTGQRGGKFKYSVYPDWFFQLVGKHPVTGHENRLRYLLEIDMHEHSGLAFVERKIKPYAIYFDSPQYRARFSANRGQCLVVTTDSHWVTILKERTENSGVSSIGRFYFTTHEDVLHHNVLTDPIWQQAGTDGKLSLLVTGQLQSQVSRKKGFDWVS